MASIAAWAARNEALGAGLRTDQVLPELVLADVLEQGGQHRQQRHRRVVDDLRDAPRLAAGVRELALLQVLQGPVQVLRCAVQKRTQCALHTLQAGLHDGPAWGQRAGVKGAVSRNTLCILTAHAQLSAFYIHSNTSTHLEFSHIAL